MFSDPRKRKINLSTYQTLTKEQLLMKNKQEREARELNLRKESASSSIARSFRAFKARKEAYDYIWNSSWKNGCHIKLSSGLKGTEADFIGLLLLVRCDQNRFPEMNSFLQSLKIRWDLEISDRLSFLIPRLLNKFFSIPLLARTVESVTDAHQKNTISQTALSRILSFISGPIIMTKLVKKFQKEKDEECFWIILQTMILGFKSGNQLKHQEFIEKFLVIPSFFNEMSEKVFQAFAEDYPFGELLDSLATSVFLNTTSYERLTIFANFLNLASVKIEKLSTSEWSLYLKIVNLFLQDVPIPSNTLSLDSDDSDDEVNVYSPLKERHLKVLTQLYEPSHILKVIKTENNDIPTICSYLAGILSRFPAERLRIASVVLFQYDQSFLRDCLEYYIHSPLAIALESDILRALGDPVYSSDWYCLTIVCEFYARMLLTVSNEEFFTRPDLIPLDLFISLIGTLKNVAFTIFWSQPLKFTAAPLLSITYLQDLIPRFLSQVHSRENQKRFCPIDHWLVSSPDLLSLLTQIPLISSQENSTDKLDACRSILEKIPFIIGFADRVKLFRSFLSHDKPGNWVPASFKADIRRGQVFEDGYAQLNALGSQLRERISISFIDHHGLPEAGIDGGGVFKEFMTECLKQAFRPDMGLFVETPGHLLYPSPSEYASQEEQLRLFEFLGRIIGKAMYERVLLETPFAYFFLAKWLGKKSYLEDLPQLDPELYSGLLFLKNYQGDVSDLCLSFSIDSQQLGETKTIPLIPNGHKVPVTRDNSMQYIYLVANYKLNVMISKPCKYFFRGLSDLINPEWLRMFSESELQILLGGEQTPIDPAEMKKYVIYDGFYDINHPTIVLFWQVVESFSPADRSLLLKFITSCSRPPLLGFGELNQKICIRVSGHGEDRLPSASTCVNLLKLPMYTSFETMSEKLLYAIRSQSGFELS